MIGALQRPPPARRISSSASACAVEVEGLVEDGLGHADRSRSGHCGSAPRRRRRSRADRPAARFLNDAEVPGFLDADHAPRRRSPWRAADRRCAAASTSRRCPAPGRCAEHRAHLRPRCRQDKIGSERETEAGAERRAVDHSDHGNLQVEQFAATRRAAGGCARGCSRRPPTSRAAREVATGAERTALAGNARAPSHCARRATRARPVRSPRACSRSSALRCGPAGSPRTVPRAACRFRYWNVNGVLRRSWPAPQRSGR